MFLCDFVITGDWLAGIAPHSFSFRGHPIPGRCFGLTSPQHGAHQSPVRGWPQCHPYHPPPNAWKSKQGHIIMLALTKRIRRKTWRNLFPYWRGPWVISDLSSTWLDFNRDSLLHVSDTAPHVPHLQYYPLCSTVASVLKGLGANDSAQRVYIKSWGHGAWKTLTRQWGSNENIYHVFVDWSQLHSKWT